MDSHEFPSLKTERVHDYHRPEIVVFLLKKTYELNSDPVFCCSNGGLENQWPDLEREHVISFCMVVILADIWLSVCSFV